MPPRRQQQFFIFLAPGASSLFIMNNSLPRMVITIQTMKNFKVRNSLKYSYDDYHRNYEKY